MLALVPLRSDLELNTIEVVIPLNIRNTTGFVDGMPASVVGDASTRAGAGAGVGAAAAPVLSIRRAVGG